MSSIEIYYCPLCGDPVHMSKEAHRDWCCLTCSNPNCLSPTTGWNTKTIVESKWLKFWNRRKPFTKEGRGNWDFGTVVPHQVCLPNSNMIINIPPNLTKEELDEFIKQRSKKNA